ncbi:unnamed protein product, partial [Mesorhabditis belari]|uniref:7TM GPCR serpentine receptor class x (Srx) domain-containing protein n=1 Tax=Mesorhabditis belari TaxID=2138241 RepID=A0AAF3EQX1_9BILA
MVIGTISALLFAFVLFYGWPKFREAPFYQIVCCLTITDSLHLLLQWLIVYPSLFGLVPEGSFLDWLQNSVVGQNGLDFTDQALFVFVTLITLNRFAVFIAQPLLILFTKRTTPITILVSLLLLILLCFFREKAQSGKHFDETQMMFSHQTQESTGENTIQTVMAVIQYTMPAVNLVCYVFIYLKLRKQRSESISASKSSDRGLLIQAFIESCLLELMRIIDMIPQPADDPTGMSLVSMLINTLKTISSVVNHTCNSLFFLTTNNTVKGVLRSLPCFQNCSHPSKRRPPSVSSVNVSKITLTSKHKNSENS